MSECKNQGNLRCNMLKCLWIEVKWSEVGSCPTLCNPMDWSLQGSSAHGIFQARVLEWVAISFSRGSSQFRDWTLVSCIAGRHLASEPPGKPFKCLQNNVSKTWLSRCLTVGLSSQLLSFRRLKICHVLKVMESRNTNSGGKSFVFFFWQNLGVLLNPL